jgi:hypothetical protein
MQSSKYYLTQQDDFLLKLAQRTASQSSMIDTRNRIPYLKKFFERLCRQYPSVSGNF